MNTEIQEFEIDNLDDFGPGSASISDDTSKASPEDLTKKGGDKPVDDLEDKSKKEPEDDDDAALDSLDFSDDDDDDEYGSNNSDNSTKKESGVVKAVQSLIKKKVLTPFVDDDGKEESLDGYTDKDYEELIKANLEQVEEKVRTDLQQNFFAEMPEEFAIAYQYIQRGGTDLKGLFKHFAENAETYESNTEDENDSETLVRNYLTLTKFGTKEEIEEQITEWKELNTISKKAEIFKPKLLDAKQKAINKKLADQAIERTRRIEAINKFQGDVVTALKKGELGGIKIDKRAQSSLYSGLVNLDYDSITGRKVNLLGHLLEKYQFVEPNLELISEALWLLQNPEEYKSKIKETGTKEAVAQTVRQLKTAEADKKTTGIIDDEPDDKSRKPKKIFKPRSIFG